MGPANGRNGQTRLDELRASGSVSGAAGVVHLGYADSGHGPVLYPDPPDRARFARADTGEAAAKLAGLIREEQADLLLSYDPQGGYGHRDHVKVHEVGARAAEMAGVRVLEATLPRELVTAALSPGAPVAARRRLPPSGDPGRLHCAVGDHAPGERAPVRAAEAGRPGGTSIVPPLRGSLSAAGPGNARTACAHLRAHVRAREVRRARRRGGHRKR